MGSRDCYTTRAVCLNIVYLESIADCHFVIDHLEYHRIIVNID